VLGSFLRVVSLSLLLVPFRATALALLERRLLMGKQSIVQVTSSRIQSAILITLVWHGYGYWAFATVSLVGRGFDSVCLMGLAGWLPRLRWLSARARALAAFGLHVTGSSLLWFLYSNADFAVVGELPVRSCWATTPWHSSSSRSRSRN
jgi:O-antigen/teichoic acid export membrane protein